MMPMSLIINIKQAMHKSFRLMGFDVVQIHKLDAALKMRERERDERHLRTIRELRAKQKNGQGGPARLTPAPSAAGPKWVAVADLWETGCSLVDEPVQSLLDIGCAFRPQDFVEAQVHICCEPYEEYMDRLIVETAGNAKFVYLRSDLEESSKLFPPSSVDTVLLIDVIEHVDRDKGLASLERLKRIARKQIAIFTPVGFMPQESHENGVDPWGMGGTDWQRHLSGWSPEDFTARDGWSVIACQDFHKNDGYGRSLDKPFGAMWAIWNRN
jgi:hypothetical protein